MRPILIVLALVLAITTGCATSTEARFTADAQRATVQVPPALTTTPVQRPYEVTLDGKDPCSLLPGSDWPTFYIEKPGVPRTAEVVNAPECFYSNDVGSFSIVLVTTEGIGVWKDGSKSATVGDMAPVQGFPALKVIVPLVKHSCEVVVDVAQGQYLSATVIPDLSMVPKLPEVCGYARQLAASALSTLVGP